MIPLLTPVLTTSSVMSANTTTDFNASDWFSFAQLLEVPPDKRNRFILAEITTNIARLMPFSLFPQEVLAEVSKVLMYLVFERGVEVTKRGDTLGYMYTIISGSVVAQQRPDTNDALADSALLLSSPQPIGHPYSFGAESLSKQPYYATYVAREKIDALALKASDWFEIQHMLKKTWFAVRRGLGFAFFFLSSRSFFWHGGCTIRKFPSWIRKKNEKIASSFPFYFKRAKFRDVISFNQEPPFFSCKKKKGNYQVHF